MISRRAALAALAALPALPARAQQTRPRAQATIDQAMAEAGLPPDRLGLFVVDLATNSVVAASLPDRAIIPASTLKLPACVAALHALGPEWRPVTRLVREGGTLTLVGGGDPLLTTDHLIELASAAVAAGVRRASAFRYNPGIVPDLPAIDTTQPLAATYNPGVSGLSVNFNRVQLTWRRTNGTFSFEATAVADRARLPLDGITLTVAGAGEGFSYRAAGDTEAWTMGGARAERGQIFMPIRQPARATARLFRRAAATVGLEVPPPEPGPIAGQDLARFEGQALIVIVPQILRWSNNLAAELVGLAAAPGAATIAAATERHSAWIRSVAPGIDWSGFQMASHSGLGAAGRASPRHLAASALLAQAEGWAALLPAYRPRDGGPPVEGAFAKSGTMAYAKSQAGLIVTGDGRWLAFGLALTDVARRAAYDGALGANDRGMPADARTWLDRAQVAEAKIIEALVAGRAG